MTRLVLTAIDRPADGADTQVEYVGPWALDPARHRSGGWERLGLVRPFRTDQVSAVGRSTELASEYLLASLAARLNTLHGRQCSLRYWRLLAMPWLVTLVQASFDRFLRILDRTGRPYEVVLPTLDSRPVIEDSRHFIILARESQALNFHLLARVIENLDPPGWHVRREIPLPDVALGPATRRRVRRLSAARWLSIAQGTLGGVQFYNVYGAGAWDLLALSARIAATRLTTSRAAPPPAWTAPRVPDRSEVTASLEESRTLAPGTGERYLRLVEQLAEEFLPLSLGREFRAYERRAARKAALTARWVDTIVCGPALGGDDEAKFYFAHMVEHRHARLIVTQHGGNYGLLDTHSFVHQTDYTSGDAFLSWGWRRQSRFGLRAVPASAPLLSKAQRAGDDGSIVLVGTDLIVFNARVESAITADDAEQYRDGKLRFLQGLQAEARARAGYRPYLSAAMAPYDEQFIAERLPDLEIVRGPLQPRLLRCRLCVVDHPGTTGFVTLAARVPTVLFWDPEIWCIPPPAAGLMEDLAAVGVFHADGASAAAHVNRIWPDVQAWWGAPETAAAVDRFAATYCRSSVRWRAEWADMFGHRRPDLRDLQGAVAEPNGVAHAKELS